MNGGDSQREKIIATKPKTGGRRGGPPRRRTGAPTARSAVLGKPQPSPAQKVSAVAAAKSVDPAGAVPADKIIVSGLPLDVNEAQVKVNSRLECFSVNGELTSFFQDLFASTIGPVREVTLTYNAHGKSKGVATVLFSRKGDGNKAYKEYNNRLIDGS